ncbi:MAG: SufD family Fe-S cluster assembly protein [Bacteriovoracaceae bacterium]|nr:SufD family Fe-S cluster assembly protein [Bacteriovoracaceae bacterium]
MKVSGFGATQELSYPALGEAWRFSPFHQFLPTEISPSKKVDSNSHIILSGETLIIQNLPDGIRLKDSNQKVGVDFWNTLTQIGGKAHLEVYQTPKEPLIILIERNSLNAEQSTLGLIEIDILESNKLQIQQTIKGSQEGLTVSQVNLNLDEKSSVDHVVSLSEGSEALNTTSFHSTLKAASNLNQTIIARGGKLTRLNVKAKLIGVQAHAALANLSMLHGKSTLDLHSDIDHQVGSTTASQLAKNLLKDESKGIFTGRVHIKKDAQLVSAAQMNRNLLMGKKAHAIGQPQLEIFADDVKCSHGSTTGQIDDEASFYLISRGIRPEMAATLLTKAFIAEVIHHAPKDLQSFFEDLL